MPVREGPGAHAVGELAIRGGVVDADVRKPGAEGRLDATPHIGIERGSGVGGDVGRGRGGARVITADREIGDSIGLALEGIAGLPRFQFLRGWGATTFQADRDTRMGSCMLAVLPAN